MKAAALILAFIVALELLVPGRAHADEKSVVQLVFALDDSHYTDEFSDDELGMLRADAASAIADALSRRFQFLQFRTDAQAEAEYVLTVSLARAEGDGTEVAEFGFHFGLSGPEVPDDAGSYLIFRDKEHYRDAIGSRAALVEEIRARVEQISRDGLINDLLRYVSIAETGEFRGGEPPIWLIDRDRNTLCITRKAHLEVQAVLPVADLGPVRESIPARVMEVVLPDTGSTASPSRPRAPIIATPAEADERLSNVDAAEVKVERVFVVAYEPICPAQPVPASQVDFSDAGGGP
ncbi:MAG: hypothetical protein AB7P52_03465 [Alphaproteobacteria bacterium]